MKIAVLYGGTTSEKEVSQRSGVAVINALLGEGHLVEGFEIKERDVLNLLGTLKAFDLVFLGFHGGYGEDGHIQAVLDVAGIPYTGSGHTSSAISMDKVLSKILFEKNNINTPKWAALYKMITTFLCAMTLLIHWL
jgi:D-alanine-D-alanine ligase